MEWKRDSKHVVGSYTVRQCVQGGWYLTLTATGETLRGPLEHFYQAREAAERYERMTTALGAPEPF